MFILKQNNDKTLIVKGFTVKPGFFTVTTRNHSA